MSPLAAILSALHLLALGVGLASVMARGRALAGTLDAAALKRVFHMDAMWGVAAILWITTGPWRAFSGLEKGTEYYLSNGLFHAKLGLFVLIVLLEVAPMTTLIRWRAAVKRGQMPDTSRAKWLARISTVQAILVIATVFVASFMARGFGAR